MLEQGHKGLEYYTFWNSGEGKTLSTRVCETIIFSGKVQGVGFRVTVVELSRGLALSGTVRNVPDGSVELVVQGTPKGIESLIERVFEHFGSFIRNVNRVSSISRKFPPGIRIIG